MATFQRKLATAQSNTLDFSNILSPNLVKLTTALADAVGCPVEFLFFPLLTTVASCIGINGSIQIKPIWQEPAILWYIIAANKGQKTAALRLLKKSILEIEEKMEQEWMAERAVDQPNIPPQLCIDHFSFEELHNVMKGMGHRFLDFLMKYQASMPSSICSRKWFSHGSEDIHNIEWGLFMDKEPPKLLRFNVKNSLQHLWIHPTSICGKDVAV